MLDVFAHAAGNYSGALLPLCRDLGDRLMMAFHTPTGLPYGTVNLRHGVPTGETPSTCAACCATFSLEFGALSHLTGDDKYYNTAKLATHVLWGHRSTESGLLGAPSTSRAHRCDADMRCRNTH